MILKRKRIIQQAKTDYTNEYVKHQLRFYYEQKLAFEVSKIFAKMEKRILQELQEYYNPGVMYKAQVEMILSPIHELHREYFETILKYQLKEYDNARATGRKIVKYKIGFKRKGNVLPKTRVLKADLTDAVSSTIIKDELFGTLDVSHYDLEQRTYALCENTLRRVDQDINNIVANGYREGMGIDKVGRDITNRFGQLKTWEANRIARTEIHISHNQGLMQGYYDMDVEYLEWSTSIDGRERDTHRELNGEIIPIGGTFSNDLHYPGDSSGIPSEIINCRCQALPFIMPYGYIAPPGMARFRESDLVATLDYFNADDLVAQAMAESDQIPEYVMKPINRDVLDNFILKPITNLDTIGKKRPPIPLTRETVKQYPEDFLRHKWYDFQEYSSPIAKHYESYYTDDFMNLMKKPIPGNTLPGTKSIYDSFKYGCGNNFGRLNSYYRDKTKYIADLRQLGESEAEIQTITERFDKIRENLLNGMKQAIPLQEDSFMFRATSTNHEIPVNVGERGTFEGFTSFSFDKETPNIYYEKDSKKYNVFYNVLAPKGTRGMALESSTKFTNTNGQAEWLTPETEYEIVYAFKDGNNYELTVRLINQII